MAADADFPGTSPVTGLYPGKLPLSVGRPHDKDTSLLEGSPVPILRLAMRLSSIRQGLTLLLAVLVTLSMSLSLVQASTMAAMDDMMPGMAKMVMGGSAHEACKDCTKSGDGAKAVACGSFCVTPAIAAMPHNNFNAPMPASVITINLDSLLLGKAPAPDPYPPRPNDLG
jgi:hypothetical protein